MAEDESGEKKASEPRYTVARLIEEAQAFLGHPSHVAAGALYGATKKELSVAEAKRLCDDFLKRPEKKGARA